MTRVTRVLIAGICPLLALFIGLAARHTASQRTASLQERTAALLAVRQSVASLEFDLLAADSGTYRFLVTGRTQDLSDYYRFRDTLPARIHEIRSKAREAGELRSSMDRAETGIATVQVSWAALRQQAALPGLTPASAPAESIENNAAEVKSAVQDLDTALSAVDGQRRNLELEVMNVRSTIGVLLLANTLLGLAAGWASFLLWRRGRPDVPESLPVSVPDHSVEALHRELDRVTDNAFESMLALAGLEEQTSVLHSVLRSMRDGVVVTRADGTLLLSNPAADTILGGQLRTLSSQAMGELSVRSADGECAVDPDQLPLARALRGEAAPAGEYLFHSPGCLAPFCLSMTAAPLIGDDGTRRGAVLVFSDISEYRRNQEAMRAAVQEADRANSAKSDFLSRMSHELRTPLNAILGFAQLLEMGKLAERDLDSVAHIMKAGRHLLLLINEVLDISRIESGRLSLSPEPILLAELLEETIMMIEPMLASGSVRLEGTEAPLWQNRVIADRQRLKQVLLNLLSNAVKYNRPGGTILLSSETDGTRLRLSVMDTGVGIASEKLCRLFQPFERLGAEESSVEGTGIGLALTKRLVEAMGGTIGVESELGRGATFWVEFSCPPAAALPPELGCGSDLLAAVQAVSTEARPTVLCVEDNPSNLRLIEQIFTLRPQLRLVTARTGEGGLEAAREQRPSLILLDVHLGDMDGGEVLEELKNGADTASIPVVVVSADATAHQRERLLKAGARNYLTKPIEVSRLLFELDETFAPESQAVAGAA